MGRKRRERGIVAPSTLQALLERSQGRCEACWKARATHAHHIKYRSRGGDSSLGNLAHLCANCHKRVHDTADPALARFRRHSWEPAPQPTQAWQKTMIFGRRS